MEQPLRSRLVTRITNLGRQFDLRLNSNRWLFVTSGLAGLISLIVSGDLGTAVGVGGSAFLAWVAARELDPDHPVAANLAVVTAPLAVWQLGRPSLLAVYLLAVTARILLRSTGLPPKRGDVVVHVVAGVIAAASGLPAVAAIGLGVAFLLDTRLPAPAPLAQRRFALALIGLAAVVGLVRFPDVTWTTPGLLGGVLIVGTVVLVFRGGTPMTSVGDFTKEPLLPARLAIGRRLAAAVALVMVSAAGSSGVAAVSPFLVAATLSGWRDRRTPS
jgi:hypothetical protein